MSHGHEVLCQNNEHCFDNKWSENIAQYEEEEKLDIESWLLLGVAGLL